MQDRVNPSLHQKVPLRDQIRKKIERAAIQERAGFEAPTSVEHARAQLTNLRAEMEIVRGQLQGKSADSFPTVGQYNYWKTAAAIALSRMKARLILLEGWLNQHKSPETTPSPMTKFEGKPTEFQPPNSIEEAEQEVANLTTEILSAEGDLSAKKNSREMPLQEFNRWKATVMAEIRPKQARRFFLNTWLKQERKKLVEAIKVKRCELATLDPNDPTNLLFHAQRLTSKILAEHQQILVGEDSFIMDSVKEYLRRNGYSD